ncbi:NAD(P)-binding domain-containing protein [Sedimentitalea sp.]|uniref:NAD(P)-binding domain-containing protein n=1 Tax=Sedimentitalea sp. TaxID=2048915 RepID=UPI003298B911
MKRTEVVIMGAGQSGLAMSRELSLHGTDHLVLERGEAGNSWRHERWDGLTLLTPDWMNALPGEDAPPSGGFSPAVAFADRLAEYADATAAPVQANTEVLSLRAHSDGYVIQTSDDAIYCKAVVIATGACAQPALPACAAALPEWVHSVSPLSYKRPSDLPPGPVLVVGASSSGQQIARELHLSGRSVTLAVGSLVRVPRQYRGADILAWMNASGLFDIPHYEVDDLERVRRTPSLALQGAAPGTSLDLNALQDLGVEIVGRLSAIRDEKALFSGGLANACAMADLKMNRLLDTIDTWIVSHGLNRLAPPPERFEPTRVPARPRLEVTFGAGGFQSVIWATGYLPDHRFVALPVFDAKRRIRHDGGVVIPGLCVMGLPYLRCRRSTFISGAGADAAALVPHLLERARCAAV